MALTWDETLLMGIPLIDDQHRQLFARLDALLFAIRSGSSAAEVARTLAFLREYVATHFTAEEGLMRESDYPLVAEHKAQHGAFTRDLALLEDEHRRDGPSPSLVLHVNARVTAWLRDHIYRLDRSLADHLRAPRR